MYEYLDGRLESRHATRVVIDVGGVGYNVAVPLGSDFRRPPRGPRGPGGAGTRSTDELVRVWTHHVVREDAEELYGFPDDEGRQLFRLLLSVRGVGPALALGILSRLSGDVLLAAIASDDVDTLLTVKGVGKKTAQQILLDLRDKAPATQASAEPGVLVPAPGRSSQVVEDAVAALLSIGYAEKEARKNVERAAREVDDGDLEALVRSALRH